MSAELLDRRCRDCVFGEQIPGRELKLQPNLPLETVIPLGIIITPKIRRNCLNIVDTVFNKRSRIVGMAAECVKPKSYSPRK